MENTTKYIKKVRAKRSLHKAWRKVRASGLNSAFPRTREDTLEYDANALHHVESLSHRLATGRFEFQPAVGKPIPRKDKDDRPLVVAPIDNKVVQRAILDTLQDIPAVKQYIEVPTSFGGIRTSDPDDRRSVATAIRAVRDTIDSGYGWYARADIKSFFVGIPREHVVAQIEQLVPDPEFVSLFERAIETELSNLDQLRGKAKLFPIYELGVAQGCCLSPFVGNTLLHHFDTELNSRGVRCFRYIDDFILFAKTQKSLKKGINRAIQILTDLGLDAYDPLEASKKSGFGQTDERIEFLGVELHGSAVRPSNRARQRLVEKIDAIIRHSTARFRNPGTCYAEHASLVETLANIDRILQGWITQYKFCNDRNVIRRLNKIVDGRIERYVATYDSYRHSLGDSKSTRQLLGVRYLEERDWGISNQ